MEKLVEFPTTVRGVHYYKKYWNPVESQCLDYFAIKTCQKDGKIIGLQWKSLDQPNIYLTEEHELLRR